MSKLQPQNPPPAKPAHGRTDEAAGDSVIGHFRPRITLLTLDRGHGLLGLKPQGKLGPRGDSVTLAQFDWLYHTDAGHRWQTPAPDSILNSRPPMVEELYDTGGPLVHMQRNLPAEADAMDRVWDMGFVPVAEETFQWRSRQHKPALGPVWTLAQEAFLVTSGPTRFRCCKPRAGRCRSNPALPTKVCRCSAGAWCSAPTPARC